MQLINYNLMIGCTKIIIYDNKDSSDTRYHSIETTSNLENKAFPFIFGENHGK